MRILSKVILSTMLLSAPVLFAACGDDTDNDGGAGDDGNGDGTGGDDNNGTGASNNNGTGGDDNNGTGASNNNGGEGPTVDCTEGAVEGAPFALDACLATGGPTSCVTGLKAAGAFVDGDWLAGWTNWSTNSTPEDDGGAKDGDLASCATGTCEYDEGTYDLQGNVYVADGATLVLKPGVVIRGGFNQSVIVQRGGKITAVGTAEKPIIFTSKAKNGAKAAGNWGGLVLLGKGVQPYGDSLLEGLPDDGKHYFGGNDDTDSSGELKYVRLEFGGYELVATKEINGLTMGGVGSGTKISYVQVNTSLDDGFEWFSGKVSADHLVSNNAGDDMFDTDESYQGTLSYLFGRQVQADSSDPNGFELDGVNDLDTDPDTAGAQPPAELTEVEVENATLCGLGGGGLQYSYGAVLRRGGLTGSFDKVIFSGFDVAVDPRNSFVIDSNPAMTIENSWSFENFDGAAYAETTADAAEPLKDDDSGFDELAWFEDEDTNTSLE